MSKSQTTGSSTSLLCALVVGLAAEAVALLALAADQPLPALAWHAIAALSSALAAIRGTHGVADARPTLAGIVSGALVLTLPALGFLGLVWIVLPHLTAPRRAASDNVLELELPAFHQRESAAFDAERGSRAIEDELAPERPIEERVRSVMALRRMDPQRAVPLLRIALADPSEDVRLLAYAILERREKQIRNRIAQALAELRDDASHAATPSESARVSLLRSLASAHWELVYGEFSEGAGQTLNLERAAHWAEAALRATFDGTTALLLARVRMRQGEAEAASRLIAAAQRAGVAAGVCAPLLAEAAFLMRKFESIPRLLARVADDPRHPPRLEPVAKFWTEGSR